MLHLGRGEHHRRAVDPGVGLDEAAFVRVDDLEPAQRLAVAAGQSAADVIEAQAELVALDGSSP